MIPGEKMEREGEEREILSSAGEVMLTGTLRVPREPRGMVLFAHGSGSSSRSPRNRYVAETLQSQGVATFLFDLMTRGEEFFDERTEQLRFDIGLLAKRLCAVTESLRRDPDHAAAIEHETAK